MNEVKKVGFDALYLPLALGIIRPGPKNYMNLFNRLI